MKPEDRNSLLRHLLWMGGLIAVLIYPIVRFGPWRHR